MDTKRHWEKGLMFITFPQYYFAGFLTNIFLPLERPVNPKTGTSRIFLIDFISHSFKSDNKLKSSSVAIPKLIVLNL